MPELLTQPKTPEIPDRWPELNRNDGRLQIGMVADITSEYPAGFNRNPHTSTDQPSKSTSRLINEPPAPQANLIITPRSPPDEYSSIQGSSPILICGSSGRITSYPAGPDTARTTIPHA